jgi:hypothetical protein
MSDMSGIPCSSIIVVYCYWQCLPLSSQHAATHAPGRERQTHSLVHPHAQITELPDIGQVVFTILYRAPQSAKSSHQNCSLAYVDCQAYIIGIPQESVHLRLTTLLASVNDREVVSKEQMRDMLGPGLLRSTC